MNPEPAAPQQGTKLSTPDIQAQQTFQALEKAMVTTSPWLFEVGSWTFGGLIAFNLLVMASLITVGPVDLAIKISTVAFALALPLNVAGLVLLRLSQDLKQVKLEETVVRAFQEAGFSANENLPSLEAIEALQQRRSGVVLIFCSVLAALSFVLTITGMVAALWHMAWWIAGAFSVMILISLVIVGIATTQLPNQRARKTLR